MSRRRLVSVAAVVLGTLLGAEVSSTQGSIFQDDFETGDISQWSSSVAGNIFVLPFGGSEESRLWRTDPTIKQADVFFDVDTTGSMDGEVLNLKAGISTIIATTQARVEDPAFGVGAFDDFPVLPFGEGADVPFRLFQGATTDTLLVQAAVNALDLHSGGDFPESGYEALFQVAVGTGVFGAGGNFGPFTTPGRIGGAQFRDDSLPVAVHLTDALAHDETTPPSVGGLSWTPDYPSNFNDHSKAVALGALQTIGARVVTVQSLWGAAFPGLDDAVTAQTREICEATDAAVPICYFKTDPVTWLCGVDTCCHGTIESDGHCILRYTVTDTGAGLTDAVADGVSAIIKYTTLDVFAEPLDDGDPGTPDTSFFFNRVEANLPNETFKPPEEPERSCTPVPTPAAFGGSGYNNGFVGFAVGAREVGSEGAKLFFTVKAQNTTVPEIGTRQFFTTFVDIVEETTGAVLDSESFIIVVPASG